MKIEKGFVSTRYGLQVDPINPTSDMFDIRDIAHSLSQMPRFGGHSYHPYTVAQHSVYVLTLVKTKVHAMPFRKKRQLCLQALLHDASEAYIMDMPTPVKICMPEYQLIEKKIMTAIFKKFNLPTEIDSIVKLADQRAFEYEVSNIINEQESDLIWTPKYAKSRFLEAYQPLS